MLLRFHRCCLSCNVVAWCSCLFLQLFDVVVCWCHVVVSDACVDAACPRRFFFVTSCWLLRAVVC